MLFCPFDVYGHGTFLSYVFLCLLAHQQEDPKVHRASFTLMEELFLWALLEVFLCSELRYRSPEPGDPSLQVILGVAGRMATSSSSPWFSGLCILVLEAAISERSHLFTCVFYFDQHPTLWASWPSWYLDETPRSGSKIPEQQVLRSGHMAGCWLLWSWTLCYISFYKMGLLGYSDTFRIK